MSIKDKPITNGIAPEGESAVSQEMKRPLFLFPLYHFGKLNAAPFPID